MIESFEEKCCDDPLIVSTGGMLVCKHCATVLNNEFAYFPRAHFADRTKQKNTDDHEIFVSSKPYTTILICNHNYNWRSRKKDANRNPLSFDTIQTYCRLSKIQQSTHGSFDHAITQYTPHINRVSELFGLPSFVVETAKALFLKSIETGLGKQTTYYGITIASIYAAVRAFGLPYTLLDLYSEETNKDMHKTYIAYKLILEQIVPSTKLIIHPITVEQLIVRFASEMQFPTILQQRAVKLYKLIKNRLPLGKDPRGVAVACAYVVGKKPLKLIQKRTCELVHGNEVTLRSRVKEIKTAWNEQKGVMVKK